MRSLAVVHRYLGGAGGQWRLPSVRPLSGCCATRDCEGLERRFGRAWGGGAVDGALSLRCRQPQVDEKRISFIGLLKLKLKV